MSDPFTVDRIYSVCDQLVSKLWNGLPYSVSDQLLDLMDDLEELPNGKESQALELAASLCDTAVEGMNTTWQAGIDAVQATRLELFGSLETDVHGPQGDPATGDWRCPLKHTQRFHSGLLNSSLSMNPTDNDKKPEGAAHLMKHAAALKLEVDHGHKAEDPKTVALALNGIARVAITERSEREMNLPKGGMILIPREEAEALSSVAAIALGAEKLALTLVGELQLVEARSV